MNLVNRLLSLFKRPVARMPKPLEYVYVNWNRLGLDDPLWAISSHPNKKGGNWNVNEFFAEGEGTIEFVLNEMRMQGVEPVLGKSLDFGCGVGRLTQALANRFVETHGVDIADSMISNANRLNHHPRSCYYHVNQKSDLGMFSDKSFDFIITLITLQHIPKKFALYYISEFMRIARTGGVIYFQVPARRKDDIEEIQIPKDPHKALEAQGPVMLMKGIPRADVEKAIQSHGGILRYTINDLWSGAEWESYRYCVEKSVPW